MAGVWDGTVHRVAVATGPGFGRALWRLVDGLYSTMGPDARLLLRQRIWVTVPLDAFDWGVYKVAARRVEVVDRPPAGPKVAVGPTAWGLPPYLPAGFALPTRLGLAEALDALEAAEALIPREGPLWSQDRPLVAFLTDADERVVGIGFNQGSRVPTRHAELMALAAGTGQRLYCSRKPCRMCAGALATLLPPGAAVWWRDFDPGRQARATVLDPESEDARRFGAPVVIQRPLTAGGGD